MHLTKARELREERRRKYEEARAIYDKSARTPEDTAKFDAIMAEVDALKIKIDAEERMEALDLELRGSGAPPRPGINPGDDLAVADAARQKRYREVWKRAMCFDGPAEHGFRGISREDREFLREFRDMGTGGGNALQGTGGGYFVPVGFVDEIESALKYYGDMLNVASMMTTATGQPLPYPTDNDTTVAGAIVGESVQVSEADVTIGNIIFGAWKYTSNMVKVSIELLQDSAFDLDSYLKEKFAIRIGRILNTHMTVGTGSSQPNGILTAAVTGGVSVTATGAAGNDGGAETGGSTIGSDDLINLEHAIDPWYRRGAVYIMHDSTLKTVKKVKDKYGRPLWIPNVAINAPDTINGYGYSINNDMPIIALNAKTVLFGNAKKYMIRKVKDISVLRLVERYADYGQVGFVAFARYDGQLLDAGTHPIAYLQQGAA